MYNETHWDIFDPNSTENCGIHYTDAYLQMFIVPKLNELKDFTLRHSIRATAFLEHRTANIMEQGLYTIAYSSFAAL